MNPIEAMRSIALLDDRHVLGGFSSGQPNVDAWVHKYARQAHRSRSARVHVVCYPPDGDVVVGFYALAAGGIPPNEGPERLSHGLGTGLDVPIAILAWLAVDESVSGQGLGSALLTDACRRVATAPVACHAIVIHAVDESAAAWYSRFGFQSWEEQPSLTLYALEKDLRETLQGQEPLPLNPRRPV